MVKMLNIENYVVSVLKEHSFFLPIDSFYNVPRFKQLSFIIFKSTQPISGFGGSTFSLA